MAGFNTAVTGIKAATTDLDVAGNNIANSSTTGFKASRVEFGDIYATAVVGAGTVNTAGSGVTVMDIATDYSAGTIEFTNNNLDLAINGSGFFQLDDGQGGTTYTRAGAFELDSEGYIVSKTGKYLQGYGLDELGNQLPLQNLAVTQKESSPHATESIDLAFNIDSAKDAELLARSFDKTNASSYSYSTTVETFDSLGNANSIRYYFVEQAAVREQFQFDVSGLPAGEDLTISGVTITSTSTPLTTAEEDALEAADPRIDLDTLSLSGGTLTFELKADSTSAGDVVISDTSGSEYPVANLDDGVPSTRAANEVQTFTIDSSLFSYNASVGDDTLDNATTVAIGGVSLEFDTGMTLEDVGLAIEDAQQEIIDNNPDIESVEFNEATGEIDITWEAVAGNVDLLAISGGTNSPFVETTPGNVDIAVVQGDNSFQGAYRMYAYLNDEQQLNLGKVVDPGESGFLTDKTEVGPIVIKFNSTTGKLAEVNGEEVPDGGTAPNITILGADPANPNDTLLDSDVDSLVGVQLDITGSSQFASDSIVKSSSQDGYPKGDLIGVAFSENGEMVASFSNGQTQKLGLVSIATFANQSGLQSSGDTEWIATFDSGAAVLNPPGTGLNGTLTSAALEQSNVDLSSELVKLIEAQRNFQANSKTLETLNTVTQSILQI
ncbi:flagellar hook protein FlgE [Neptunomonas phycophila]|jgi:flagellar hook protein FlgE|uniref:flagellar hook protein FlgE n=1 Tax=Neptunomonas phycophila TaxID=1572645 RepID=UPI000948CA4D|nr:flagellar hook-basal body complex protein [Neptunomonas phycophila]